MNVLRLLVESRNSSAAVDVLRLREETRQGFEESERLLQRMLNVGWVARIRAERSRGWRLGRRSKLQQDRWVLLANPDKLTVAEVYQLFAFAPAPQSPLGQKVEGVIALGLSSPIAAYFAASAASAAKANNASST
jgi:membrane protein